MEERLKQIETENEELKLRLNRIEKFIKRFDKVMNDIGNAKKFRKWVDYRLRYQILDLLYGFKNDKKLFKEYKRLKDGE